jgi:hypothetical protein
LVAIGPVVSEKKIKMCNVDEISNMATVTKNRTYGKIAGFG